MPCTVLIQKNWCYRLLLKSRHIQYVTASGERTVGKRHIIVYRYGACGIGR